MRLVLNIPDAKIKREFNYKFGTSIKINQVPLLKKVFVKFGSDMLLDGMECHENALEQLDKALR